MNLGNNIAALKHYWQALALSPSYIEAMVGTARLLRKSGDRGRLFQLITRLVNIICLDMFFFHCCYFRWQSILAIANGQSPSKSHLYLSEWHLKHELNNKAKAYDGCPYSCVSCLNREKHSQNYD